MVVVGSRGPVEINPRDLMSREACVMGVMLPNASAEEDVRTTAAIHDGLSNGSLRPVIGESFSLEDAARAHQEVIQHTRGSLGKIILTPWGDEAARDQPVYSL